MAVSIIRCTSSGDAALSPGLGHRGHERGLERRLVLFEIERHLLVGHLAQQGPREEPARRAHQQHAGDDAEPEDGGGGEAEVVEGRGNRDIASRPATRKPTAPRMASLARHRLRTWRMTETSSARA
jgi:hypothetical protein